MNLQDSQDSIIAQVQGVFTANSLPFQCKELPEAEADYIKAVQQPIVFVVYTGSTSPGIRNTNPVAQDRKVQFSIECFSRVLYGASGLFVLRNYIEKALIGFRPTNCRRMYLVQDQIDKGQDSIWTHVYKFECETVLVQDELSDPVVVPQMNNVTSDFQNTGNSDDDGNGSEVTIIPVS